MLFRMTAVELLKHEADMAFADLMAALEGVEQPQSWSVLEERGTDYLHSDASIHGITLHIASGKVMYGSVGFRSTERRWRDCADEIGKFEPSWSAAVQFLEQSHQYWMKSWLKLTDHDLENEVPHFSGKLWPAWKVVRMVIYHDAYHTGQIAMLRYACSASEIPPPSVAEDIRKYCVDLPSW